VNVDKLQAYRDKRDSSRTPEPVPAASPAPEGDGHSFVIQEHHARRLHWDFRLERDGVLISALDEQGTEIREWLSEGSA